MVVAELAPAPEESVAFGLLSRHCYDTFADGHLFDAECLQRLIAKGLGIALILGSMFVRVPQIIAIHRGRGVEGLSVASIYSDVPSYLLAVMYYVLQGSPFSAWGEIAFLLIQALIIVAQYFYFSAAALTEIGFGATAFGSVVAAAMALPEVERSYLLLATLPMTILSRGSQVWVNYAQGHTGRLSAITVTLNFLGSVARVFTTAVEVKGDVTAMLIVCVATAWNTLLFLQIIFYRNATKRALARREEKEG